MEEGIGKLGKVVCACNPRTLETENDLKSAWATQRDVTSAKQKSKTHPQSSDLKKKRVPADRICTCLAVVRVEPPAWQARALTLTSFALFLTYPRQGLPKLSRQV